MYPSVQQRKKSTVQIHVGTDVMKALSKIWLALESSLLFRIESPECSGAAQGCEPYEHGTAIETRRTTIDRSANQSEVIATS
jgi:hypothetical protein